MIYHHFDDQIAAHRTTHGRIKTGICHILATSCHIEITKLFIAKEIKRDYGVHFFIHNTKKNNKAR